MSEELPSVVPEYRERRITYTVEKDEMAPQEDQFLITIGQTSRKCNTVYLVVSRRLIRPVSPRRRLAAMNGQRKWELRVVKCPELLEKARVRTDIWYCWLEDMDVECFPCFWGERKRKKPL